MVRLGNACLIVLLTAVAVGLPSAYRALSRQAGMLDAWLIASALMASVLLPVVLLVPKAARGWRGIVGRAPPRSFAHGLAMWAGLSIVLLSLLGLLLKAKTHHRGLGGATFGILGAASVCFAAVLSGRLLALGRWLHERSVPAKWLRGGSVVVAVAPLLLLGLALLAGNAGGSAAATQAAVCDLLLAVALLALLLARPLPEATRKLGRIVALPTTIGLICLGLGRAELSATAATSLRGGGLPAAILGGLQMWSDRDGDGHSAHFGGHDCDEGDPLRHPGATDKPGDGVDSNCDGHDQALPSGTAAPRKTSKAATPPASTASTSNAVAQVPSSKPTTAAAQKLPSGGSGKRPDIILVTLDTVRADHSSAYGYNKDTTPRLAKLAAQGMLFEHAYAIASDTQHALMPIVSGRPLSKTPRTKTEWPTIHEEAKTVAERMGFAGYKTAAVSSFTWLRKDRGFAQGFEHFDESPFRDNHPERKSTGKKAADVAIALHKRLAKETAPIFLWVHFFDAHADYLTHPGIDFGRGALGRYDGEIAFVDLQLGRLVDAVSASGRSARTLWLVHGSHGEAFNEHGFEGHGADLHDEVLRVPLVMVVPGGKTGRYGRDAVATLDIAPTLLDFAGGSRDGVMGVSLRRAAEGDGNFERAPFFAHAWRRTAVVDWPLKLLSYRRKSGQERLFLFDLAADPGELRDIAGSRADDLARLDELRKRSP